MKIKVAVVTIAAFLLMASSASAGYQLIFGYAKRAMAQEAASVCRGVEECKSWSISPCARRSWHRVDCRANFFFPEAEACTMVLTATLPPWAEDVIIHHKRIFC